jgi:hypothetical protein
MATAVRSVTESAAAKDVLASLSDDFDGHGGELDRRALAKLVSMTSLRDKRVGVTTGPISIEHRGERMVASFVVALANRSRLLRLVRSSLRGAGRAANSVAPRADGSAPIGL